MLVGTNECRRKQAKNVSKWDIRSRVLPSTPFLVVEEGVQSFRQLKPIVCTRRSQRGNNNVFLRITTCSFAMITQSTMALLLIYDNSSPPLGSVWDNSDKYFGQIGWQIPYMYINISDESVDGFHVYKYIGQIGWRIPCILKVVYTGILTETSFHFEGGGAGSLQGNTNHIIYLVDVILHRPNISCYVCIYV